MANISNYTKKREALCVGCVRGSPASCNGSKNREKHCIAHFAPPFLLSSASTSACISFLFCCCCRCWCWWCFIFLNRSAVGCCFALYRMPPLQYELNVDRHQHRHPKRNNANICRLLRLPMKRLSLHVHACATQGALWVPQASWTAGNDPFWLPWQYINFRLVRSSILSIHPISFPSQLNQTKAITLRLPTECVPKCSLP